MKKRRVESLLSLQKTYYLFSGSAIVLFIFGLVFAIKAEGIVGIVIGFSGFILISLLLATKAFELKEKIDQHLVQTQENNTPTEEKGQTDETKHEG
ncbi:hypothetical protein A2239_04650 [Candidatus Uhrbacteria bacterium RIFOXYA2_FULL_40_9]|nr:MAG: hypothetical protein UT94_C0040G0013 [Candidatus Uhrbacteria bacterium GW2011_GWF2_40_263]OGL93965.1 MAG: hypothetical protein A2239_04650 [Candidatus Uhrbacteria bacterium RIFOXYA2_FULL_40_9]OGL97599.1 MAG: hypothetical protein A2332_03120 [Candidatus Uhrbacteria bacterium RIFOXYB2_FULL_41_18]HBK34924.1 hypothetical protein [Candidatus Uhrbacteria bacterium]HCB55357.1 hypothetical protein [Candidatus Uhrbacteria bacterium]